MDLNKKEVGNADVIPVIPLDEIVYLLEDYTEHLEKLFEVNLTTYSGIINAMVNIKEQLHRIELIREKKRAFGSDHVQFGDYSLSFDLREINKILNDKQQSLEAELKVLANKLLKEDDTDVTS